MPKKKCESGKVINPLTGRCVYKDSPVLKKQINPLKKTHTVKVISSPKNVKEVIKLEIQPYLYDTINLNKSNLDKLAMWWKQRLVNFDYIETINVKVVPDYDRERIIIFYDMPQKFIYDNPEDKLEDIKINNEMISQADNNGNYPVYIKNKNIVSIDRDVSNGGKSSLVSSRLLKTQTVKMPLGPNNVVSSSKILINCGENKYINPFTNRCVQSKNIDIQYYIQKKGYQLQSNIDEPDKKLSYTTPAPVPKISINNPKNVDNKDIKVLVPPDTKDKVKLIFCGKGMVINPSTGRCIKLSGKLGQKLTSVPYIIVNPTSKPQKAPLFIPDGPKEPNKPAVKVTMSKKEEKIKTGLDTDGDNYVSIKEYLDSAQSKGPLEKGAKDFAFYNQRNLGILFILNLINNFKGPIHHIGCIPLFSLCVYKDATDNLYTKQNNKYMLCDRNKNYYYGGKFTRASIVIINAPLSNSLSPDNSTILIPPNLEKSLQKCKTDGKSMVVCDLTLLIKSNFLESSHSNVIIFDTRRKTIERFDPHGGKEYEDVKLVYDVNDELSISDRKDFKNQFGIINNNNKKKSNALYDQYLIDKKLSKTFKNVLPDYTYYGTNYTTPYLGPQIKADEYGGLCVTWSCMYMILRLLNPDLNPSEITIKMIDGPPNELKNRILRFQKFIIRTLSKKNKT